MTDLTFKQVKDGLQKILDDPDLTEAQFMALEVILTYEFTRQRLATHMDKLGLTAELLDSDPTEYTRRMNNAPPLSDDPVINPNDYFGYEGLLQ